MPTKEKAPRQPRTSRFGKGKGKGENSSSQNYCNLAIPHVEPGNLVLARFGTAVPTLLAAIGIEWAVSSSYAILLAPDLSNDQDTIILLCIIVTLVMLDLNKSCVV